MTGTEIYHEVRGSGEPVLLLHGGFSSIEAMRPQMDALAAAGWQGIDSTYLVCGQDRSTSVALQREHAARATRSVELPTGHHPFISRPDLVVEQVRRLL